MTNEERTITRNEYLQLVGLIALAQRHNQALRELDEAARAITHEERDGHTSDTIYDSFSLGVDVDDLLRRLKIAVEPDAERVT